VSREPIRRLVAKNYGCLKDVSIELTPLHAFIGPNDSGKSTILRAVRTLLQLASGTFQLVDNAWREPFTPYITSVAGLDLAVSFADETGYRIRSHAASPLYSVIENGFGPRCGNNRNFQRELATPSSIHELTAMNQLGQLLAGSRLLRLDPDVLKEPSSLIPEGRSPSLLSERGQGLAGVYDAIMNRDVESFLAIQKKFIELFPTMKKLGLRNVTDRTKALQIELEDGTRVPAEQMSEGMLLYLAFAALPSIDPVAVLLVEEPENGLHPARIADVMRILREISKETQVLIATHSPLVVNELEPEEVSVVTRKPGEGTRVTPIKDTPDFAERSRVYALGELWVSYADGTYEEPLFTAPRVGG